MSTQATDNKEVKSLKNTSDTPKVILNTRYFMQQRKATANDFLEARSAIFALGIKTKYGPNRMVFTAARSKKSHPDNVYAQECAGLVLDMQNDWKPLMVPPRDLRFAIDTPASNKFLHQGLYHIYKVEEGTCFGLYWYKAPNEEKGKWCISTSSAYEMNNNKWGGKTYQVYITECLQEIGLTWESFTDKLDKKCCYSFGFHHDDFHHFREGTGKPIKKLWFIHLVFLDPESKNYMCESDMSPCDEIKSQKFYQGSIGSLRDLYILAKDAYKTYAESLEADDGKSPEINYGYILRSTNVNVTNQHSDLFIESRLMKTIRQIWYDHSLVRECNSNEWDKNIAMPLNAYLSTELYEKFNLLFPQYKNTISKFANLTQEVVESMIKQTKQTKETKEEHPIDDLARRLLAGFKRLVKFNTEKSNVAQLRRMYMEFSLNPEYLRDYMELWNHKEVVTEEKKTSPSKADSDDAKVSPKSDKSDKSDKSSPKSKSDPIQSNESIQSGNESSDKASNSNDKKENE